MNILSLFCHKKNTNDVYTKLIKQKETTGTKYSNSIWYRKEVRNMNDDYMNQNNSNNSMNSDNQTGVNNQVYQGSNFTMTNSVQDNAGINRDKTAGGVYSGSYLAGMQNNSQNGATGSAENNIPNGAQAHNRTYSYSSRYPNNFTSASDSSQSYRGTTGNGQSFQQTPPQKSVTKKKKGGFKKVFACAGLGICFGVCAGLSFYAVDMLTGSNAEKEQTVAEVEAVESVTETADSPTEVKTVATVSETGASDIYDISGVVDQVMPSMVSIVNTYTESISYFGQNFSQEENASGSGIIVGQNEEELLIVTNYHVIQGADSLAVSFVDDSVSTAQVKGTDASMDLAVIAIPLEDLEEETLGNIAVAQLGDSDSLKLGEPAIAIGNALGYGQSVTTGVISALDREIAVSDTGSGTFIQTNAAINPGNSGGALLNIKGEVIGINSNKIGGSAIEGMGYAIPISSAKPIIEDLMNRETKTKVGEENMGYLGITGVTVTTDVASVYGMPEGVYVTQVYRGTGAERAGISKGSIITALDGISISGMDELKESLQYYAVGDTVEVTVMQSGIQGYEEKTVSVTLGTKIE